LAERASSPDARSRSNHRSGDIELMEKGPDGCRSLALLVPSRTAYLSPPPPAARPSCPWSSSRSRSGRRGWMGSAPDPCRTTMPFCFSSKVGGFPLETASPIRVARRQPDQFRLASCVHFQRRGLGQSAVDVNHVRYRTILGHRRAACVVARWLCPAGEVDGVSRDPGLMAGLLPVDEVRQQIDSCIVAVEAVKREQRNPGGEKIVLRTGICSGHRSGSDRCPPRCRSR
jgi:hypothetical protein